MDSNFKIAAGCSNRDGADIEKGENGKVVFSKPCCADNNVVRLFVFDEKKCDGQQVTKISDREPVNIAHPLRLVSGKECELVDGFRNISISKDSTQESELIEGLGNMAIITDQQKVSSDNPVSVLAVSQGLPASLKQQKTCFYQFIQGIKRGLDNITISKYHIKKSKLPEGFKNITSLHSSTLVSELIEGIGNMPIISDQPQGFSDSRTSVPASSQGVSNSLKSQEFCSDQSIQGIKRGLDEQHESQRKYKKNVHITKSHRDQQIFQHLISGTLYS